MPQIKFNWVDVIILTLLIRISYIAYKNGFLPEICRLLGFIFALVLTVNNYTYLSEFFSRWIKAENSAQITGAGVIFLGTLFCFKILSVFISFLLKSENVSPLNRIVGLLIGISRSALLSSILLTITIISPFENLKKSIEEKSYLSSYILKIAPFTYKSAIKFYPGIESENPLTEFLKK